MKAFLTGLMGLFVASTAALASPDDVRLSYVIDGQTRLVLGGGSLLWIDVYTPDGIASYNADNGSVIVPASALDAAAGFPIFVYASTPDGGVAVANVGTAFVGDDGTIDMQSGAGLGGVGAPSEGGTEKAKGTCAVPSGCRLRIYWIQGSKNDTGKDYQEKTLDDGETYEVLLGTSDGASWVSCVCSPSSP